MTRGAPCLDGSVVPGIRQPSYRGERTAMRVAVIGSRTVVGLAQVVAAIEESGFTDISLIVSGGARGVDTLAEQYARNLLADTF